MSDTEEPVVPGEEKTLSKKKIRKNAYWAKLENALAEYKNILLIGIDFVGSRQMMDIRRELRGQAVIIMGKNTIMRKVIRDNAEKYPALQEMLPYIIGNVGMVFTNDTDLKGLRDKITSQKQPAAAKPGIVAPSDVEIPAGPTGLDPGQTSFFQTLNISTKISKGSIEITSNVKICIKGEKVTTSAVALLSKLGIRPFEFGITCTWVYDNGSLYSSDILDMTDELLMGKFCSAARRLAAISFTIGQVNGATVPHSMGRAFRLLCAVAIAADYEFEELKAVKEAAAAGAAGGGGGGAAPAAAAAAAAPEPEEEEEAAPAMDMFGGDEEEAGDY